MLKSRSVLSLKTAKINQIRILLNKISYRMKINELVINYLFPELFCYLKTYTAVSIVYLSLLFVHQDYISVVYLLELKEVKVYTQSTSIKDHYSNQCLNVDFVEFHVHDSL